MHVVSLNDREDGLVSDVSDEVAVGLRIWLTRNQFELVAPVGGDSASFGDRQDTWDRNGTRVRLTRDRGQWWCDLSRLGSNVWLDLDDVAGALGVKFTDPVERLATAASSIDDRVFDALSTGDGTYQQMQPRNSAIGGVLVLASRGLLLWVVVPVASVVWLAVALPLRKRGVTFFQYLGWVDLNLIAFLQRGPLRPLVRRPASFVPSIDMPSVAHRLRTADPA